MEKNATVRHRTRPGEPFAVENMQGIVLRVTPSARSIPAQAHVRWGDFETWEKQSDIECLSE